MSPVDLSFHRSISPGKYRTCDRSGTSLASVGFPAQPVKVAGVAPSDVHYDDLRSLVRMERQDGALDIRVERGARLDGAGPLGIMLDLVLPAVNTVYGATNVDAGG